MHRVIAGVAAIVLLISPAYAQGRGKGSKRPDTSQQTEDKKKNEAEAEKAYRDSLRSIPDQKASDPWRTCVSSRAELIAVKGEYAALASANGSVLCITAFWPTRLPQWVNSTHYRSATLPAASPQLTDIRIAAAEQ
jgi:hypothetical protein